jgi:hypothetical protein
MADHKVKLTVEGKDASLVKEAFSVLHAALEPGDILRVTPPTPGKVFGSSQTPEV